MGRRLLSVTLLPELTAVSAIIFSVLSVKLSSLVPLVLVSCAFSVDDSCATTPTASSDTLPPFSWLIRVRLLRPLPQTISASLVWGELPAALALLWHSRKTRINCDYF